MKAVVVEIREKYAAVLSDDGCISKVINRNYVIGQEINMSRVKNLKRKKLTWIACVACVAIFISAGGGYAYATPYSYVSLDTNSSIEFSLNRFNQVISVNAVNEDGKKLLKEISIENLSHKQIDQALKITVEQLLENGYESDGEIVLSTSGKDIKKAAKLATKLEQCVKEDLDQENKNDSVQVEVISVGKERVTEAQKLGVTPGKLNLVEKLQSSAPNENIQIADWINKPVKDIIKETNKNKQQMKNQEKKIRQTQGNKISNEKKNPYGNESVKNEAAKKANNQSTKLNYNQDPQVTQNPTTSQAVTNTTSNQHQNESNFDSNKKYENAGFDHDDRYEENGRNYGNNKHQDNGRHYGNSKHQDNGKHEDDDED